jgi:hypothetical protein
LEEKRAGIGVKTGVSPPNRTTLGPPEFREPGAALY